MNFSIRTYLLSCLLFPRCSSLQLGHGRLATAAFSTTSSASENVVSKTRYTIDCDVCPPTEERVLKKIVQKHCQHLDQYLQNRPIAAHTRAAFDLMMEQIPHLSSPDTRIILDSGCGTGRSTRHLGNTHPDHFIIGVDRSFARLTRNGLGKDEVSENSEESLRPFQVLSDNIILVRAELTDFWRCCLDAKMNVREHFILYPNPYPTKKRIKQRFYGHPSFPLILRLGGDITLRSNWEGYLEEFSRSICYADDFYSSDNENSNIAAPYVDGARIGPKERTDKTIAWTNFEKKYDTVGEKTYELLLKQSLGSQ